MPDVLLDTDVVSYIFKNDTRADLYLPHLVGVRPALSFMTIAELYRWALARNWGRPRRNALDRFLQSYMVYPYTRPLCLKWAEVVDQARRRGRPIADADAWHAATALLEGIPLITHNVRDFRVVDGLTIITAAG